MIRIRIDASGRLLRGGALAFLGALLAVTSAAAQNGPRVITLDEAIAIALEQNPQIQQAQNSARLSTLAVRQEQRDLLPDVRLTTATNQPYASAFGQTDNSVTGGISMNLQVPNLYATYIGLGQARINERSSEETLERARQSVIYDVISAYFAVLEAQEQVTVQRQNLEAVRAQEAQIQTYFDAGVRPISDVYQQQAATAGAQLGLVQAERGLVVARMNLIRALQLDPFGEYEFTEPDIGRTLSADTLDLASLAEQAMARRPDLIAARLQLDSAEEGVKIANASRWPSFSLSLSYRTNYNSLTGSDVFDQLERSRAGNIQFGVSVPLFDATNGITRERARIQANNAEIALGNTEQTVATEIRTAYLDLELAEQQLEVAELQLRAAELALQTAEQRYSVGAGTLLEVTQARTTQVAAARDLVSARYGLALQSRLLEFYLGTLGPEF